LGDGFAGADDDGRRMAGVDVVQGAGGDVEVGEDRGGEAGVGELVGDGGVDGAGDGGQVGAFDPGGAGGAEGDGGGERGAQAVAEGVEDGDPGDVVVDGVVVGVAADGVARFKDRGDDEVFGGEGQGWQEPSEGFRANGCGLGSAGAAEGVAVLGFRDDEVAEEPGDGVDVAPDGVVVKVEMRRQGDVQDAESFGPVDDRHPQPFRVAGRDNGCDQREGAAGEAAVDRDRLLVRLAWLGQHPQRALFGVGEMHGGMEAQRSQRVGQGRGEPAGRQCVTGVDQAGKSGMPVLG
jgi:hypothetical protein